MSVVTWIRGHLTRRASPAVVRAQQTRRELLEAAERREEAADAAETRARTASRDPGFTGAFLFDGLNRGEFEGDRR